MTAPWLRAFGFGYPNAVAAVGGTALLSAWSPIGGSEMTAYLINHLRQPGVVSSRVGTPSSYAPAS